jgi:hypothetical protein
MQEQDFLMLNRVARCSWSENPMPIDINMQKSKLLPTAKEAAKQDQDGDLTSGTNEESEIHVFHHYNKLECCIFVSSSSKTNSTM